jgi:DNA-nicking Smr family endonuclease
MKRRDPTEGEIRLWEEVTREVVPVKRARRKPRAMVASEPLRQGGTSTSLKKSETPGLPPSPAADRHKQPAVQRLDGSTLRRLSEGKVEPEAKIDLHGMTQVQAHSRLVTFIHRAHAHGLRCVLVVTGKGSGHDRHDAGPTDWMHDGTRGVLRSLVPRWLAEGEMKRHVTGVAGAHVRHGGGGALYVYLRRVRTRTD